MQYNIAQYRIRVGRGILLLAGGYPVDGVPYELYIRR